MPYDSALKRYHKLLLKRRQWTTKIGRILASTTPMTTAASTTTSPTPITKKMPKSLKSIYSTINLRTTTTEVPSTISRVTAKTRGTFKPHGTRKGWRMWKKVTPKYAGKLNTTTTEARSTSTISPTEPNTFAPSTDSSITVGASSTSIPLIPELPLIEEEEEVTGATTEQPTSTTTTEATTATTPTTATETTTRTTTMAPTTTSTSTSTSEEGKVPSSLRYICRHKVGSNEHDPFNERRASTIGPFRPISVGHKWKPLRFKKPEPPVDEIDNTVSSNKTISPRPTGLRLLEYLLKQTDTFAKGLQKAIDGPNTELLAAIKDVVAKFKASLDEAGIDQDVRQMGNQLKNTWQQLRTGPMNEQIGRILEKAVADAADQKQQQQIQKVQQQLASSRLSN
uniref:Uncharacterized protein n=1 Tax=Caenorhabditis japonica TaxID=281687 RepID=A0A8R1HL51_CAEJA